MITTYDSVPSRMLALRGVTYSWLNLERLVFWFSGLYLWTLVLDAPLRYSFGQLHLNTLIYVPKLLLLAAVILLPLLRPRASLTALLITGLIGLYLIWGMINLANSLQPLFGFWVLVPLLFGLWAGPLVDIARWRLLLAWLFVLTALGVFLNPLIPYPWSGQHLEELGHYIEISRRWSAYGVERYAGFARGSFNAASQLLLLGSFLVILLRQRYAKLLIWLVAGSGIALTTSKGPLGAWLLLSIYFSGGGLLYWPKYWIQFWLGIFLLILFAIVLIPLSSLWIHYNAFFHNYTMKFLFASFGDRLNWMWPNSLHLLNLDGTYHWWVGRGLGGIGTAQRYFESAHYLAADNMFVYMTVDLGLPITIMLLAMLWIKFTSAFLSFRLGIKNYLFPLVLGIFLYGIVVNIFEGNSLAFFLGIILARHSSHRANGRVLRIGRVR